MVGGRVDAVQCHVDDVLGEPVGQWRVAVQQPVIERAVEQVERYFDVGAGGDLAAFDGAVEDGPCLVAAGFDQAPAVFGGEYRVGLCLGDQCGDDPAVGAAAGQLGPGAQQREQVTAQGAGVAGVGAGGGPLGVQGVEGGER